MTDWDELLKDLQDRRDTARAMGGSERLEQHRRDGRLDARARVHRLLDEDTFVELGTLVGSVHRGVVPPVPADGLIAGHGLIDGRPVLVGAEDFTVMGGSIGRGTTAKRQRLTELAAQERVPLVMLLEGAGELGLQFGADEFEDGQASEDVIRRISRDLCPIQDGKVKRNQQGLEIAGGGFAGICGTLRRNAEKRRTGSRGGLHPEERVDAPEEADVAGKMRAQLFSYTRAQVHVIAQVVHAELKVGQGDD